MNLAAFAKTAWTKATSRPALAAAALLAGVLVAGECNRFRGQARREAVPTPAPPTKLELGSRVVTLPCETVQTLEPGRRDRERLAERYHRPDLRTPAGTESASKSKEPNAGGPSGKAIDGQIARILGERELPALPRGGTALITFEPGGAVAVTVAPKPERLFELSTTWEVGALAGVGTAGDTRARGWAAVEPLRWGNLHLRAEAGADLRAGTSDAYAMVGAVWRSKR